MKPNQLAEALAAVGEAVESTDLTGAIRLLIAGGSAGLLGGMLDRVTGDCDVIGTEPNDQWPAIEKAAQKVAIRFGLPERWLNQDCRSFAYCLPPGWESRCAAFDRFGPLEVCTLSRIDLIASKVVSSAKRPQDIEDLKAIRPSPSELDFAEDNLDRLERESLDGKIYEIERTILKSLRESP